MAIMTIPKKVTKGADLVLLPRKDYERIVRALKRRETDTKLDPDLKKALEEIKYGKTMGPFSSVAELKQSLEK